MPALMAAGRRAVVLDDLSGGSKPGPCRRERRWSRPMRAMRARWRRSRRSTASTRRCTSRACRGWTGRPEAAARDAAMSAAFAGACARAGVRRLVLASSAAVYGAGAGPVSAYGAAKRAAEDAVRGVFSGSRAAGATRCCAASTSPAPSRGEPRRAGPGPGADRLRGGAGPARRRHAVRDRLGHRRRHLRARLGPCPRRGGGAPRGARGALEGGATGLTADVGTGRGHSVRAVLAAVERASGTAIAVRAGARRPGDVAASVAAPQRIARLPGWRARGGLDESVAATLARLRAGTPPVVDPPGGPDAPGGATR